MGSGQRPLPAMTAAALLASNKALLAGSAQAAIAQLQETLRTQLNQVPDDIDWLAFQAGAAKYAAMPLRHQRPTYPVLAYGRAQAARVSLLDAGGTGPTVVLVPSMVNRGYVLDLGPGTSLTEHLRTAGHRVLLVDWGDPAAQPSAPLSLNAVVTEGLEPLLQAAAGLAQGPVAVVGYCMGGLLAVAAAARLGRAVVGKLAVAAMPWDFTHTASHTHMAQTAQWLRPLLQAAPTLAPEPMAQYFWSLDPWGPIRRIMAYGLETDPTRLEHLTRLEDWLADGLALDSPIAEEMLLGWYAENTAFKGQWVVGGTPILPQSLAMPLHITLTQTDILVPLNASLPFIGQIGGQTHGATVHMAQTGHVSLVAGRRAKAQFYEPLVGWLTKV